MSEDYFLYAKTKKVPVSKAVYYAYKRSVWRERKRKAAQADMECSYDSLVASGMEIPSADGSFEELMEDRQLLASLLMALDELTDDERGLIDALFYQTQTERDFSEEIGVPHQTIHKRKNAILQKLKGLLRI